MYKVSQTSPVADSSSSAALSGGATFTGPWIPRDLSKPVLMTAVATDVAGTLYVEFSPNASDIDSTLTYTYTVGDINPPQPLTVTRNFVRVRFVNGAAAQSYFRLDVALGLFPSLTSPLQGTIAKNFPANVTRSFSERLSIALGLYEDHEVENKFGYNGNISTAGNADLVNMTGTYTGFPTGAAEQFQIILSSGTDVGGSVTFRYLADYTSTEWQQATIVTTGTTTNTGITGVRSTRGVFNNSNGTANVGTVSLRHITTTANVFWLMGIGRGQTQVAADVIPAGNKFLLQKIVVQIPKNNGSATITGNLWVRPLGGSPRLLRPFSASNTQQSADTIDIYQPLDGWADIKLRIATCSANNTPVYGAFDGYRVKV